MHLKKEFNCFRFDTLDLVKYEREIKLEFYKNFSSDSIKDIKRKKRPNKPKNGEGKEDNEILDN